MRINLLLLSMLFSLNALAAEDLDAISAPQDGCPVEHKELCQTKSAHHATCLYDGKSYTKGAVITMAGGKGYRCELIDGEMYDGGISGMQSVWVPVRLKSRQQMDAGK